MDSKTLRKYVDKQFSINVLPNLMNFIRIPNLSPEYDQNWKTNGLILKAASLVAAYAKYLNIKNAEVNLLQDKDYTPLVFIEIPASSRADTHRLFPLPFLIPDDTPHVQAPDAQIALRNVVVKRPSAYRDLFRMFLQNVA